MSDGGGHFTLDELRACCRGEDASLITPVVEHCKTCEYCGDRVAVFLAMDRIRANERRSRFKRKALAMAANVVAGLVIAVAVGLLFAGYRFASSDLPPSQEVADLATTAPPAADAPVGGDAATSEANQPPPDEGRPGLAPPETLPDEGVVGSKAMQPLVSDAGPESTTTPMRDTLASLATTEPPPAAVVRFMLGSAVPVDSGNIQGRLQAVGEALTRGEYARAAGGLEELHSERPDSGAIAGFLGISLYLAGEDSGRVGRFLATGALDQNESVSSFSRWYLANHLLRTGDEEGARQLLVELAAFDDSRPARMAADLLLQLERGPLP